MTRPIDDIDFEIGGIEIAMQVLQRRWTALESERAYALRKVIDEIHGPPPNLPEVKDEGIRRAFDFRRGKKH